MCYGPALVRGIVRLHARLLAIALCCSVCGVTAAGGADPPTALQERVTVLRSENATLAQRMQRATLELYSLDAQLRRVQGRITSLGQKHAALARERRSIQMQLDVSRHDLRVSQRHLARLVHFLYERQADDDPLAILFGARSLEDAITMLDDLGRTAQQSRLIATRSRDAQAALTVLTQRLARQDARVRALEAAALQTSASLIAAEQSRRRYVSTLAARRNLNDAQISRVDALARASVAAMVATPAPSPAASSSTTSRDYASGARSVTVVASGYSLGGATATGLPVGWGTVAVDPSVIPLGTRLTIPGYGEGVAADTGSAVQGATIDLWFPSVRQALAWGRRVVTVTLH